MTVDEFMDYLMGCKYMQDYIVRLRYKYASEKEWTESNEILEVAPSGVYEWLNDWDEGQKDVEVIGWIPVSDVKDLILPERDLL